MALNDPTQNNQLNNIFNPNNNFGQNLERPYIKGMSEYLPQPMAGNITQDDLYPLQSSLQTPQLNTPVLSQNVQTFSRGGKVKNKRQKTKKEERNNPYPTLAEMIRQQGGEEDTILAHINPLEARMLSCIAYEGGRINPITGLPQFGLFDNPKKWFKGSVGGGAGAIIGNILLPGIGGVIGGAIGGAVGSKVRGRDDWQQAGLRGAAMGAAIPTVSGLVGSGLAKAGATSVGKTLGLNKAASSFTNYAAKNAVMKSIGMENTFNNVLGSKEGITSPGSSNVGTAIEGAKNIEPSSSNAGFMDKWLKPKNALTALSVIGSMTNKPKKEKKESPESKGRSLALQQKAYDKGLQLSPEERAAREADMLAERQMQRRIDRNQYAADERFTIKPTYRKIHTPEEYNKNKRWVSYYDNPEMQGNSLAMKKGGKVANMLFEQEEIFYPNQEGYYFKGHTMGQDDKIKAKLSDGEYVIPADVVAHAGDGNSDAGAKHFDKLLKDIRKSKGTKDKLPPKIPPLISLMMPSKQQSLMSRMR